MPGGDSSGPATSDDGEGSSSTTPGIGDTCDVWAQDCETGKCMPQGTDAWETARCEEVWGDDQLGDWCERQGGPYDGSDSCGHGLMCFWSDRGMPNTTCSEMCRGTPAAPICETPDTRCYSLPGQLVNLCLTYCDPLAQDCPDGETCVLTTAGPSTHCWSEPTTAGFGEQCDVETDCHAGLACVGAAVVPACAATTGGCCTEVCDLEQPNTCTDAAVGVTCQPRFDSDLPGLYRVGSCML
jgi:hypothetical protein